MRPEILRRLPILLTALWLIAGPGWAQTESDEPATPTAQLHLPETTTSGGDQPTASRCRIRVTSPQSGNRRAFSATEILDLDLRVTLRTDVTGDHLLHVRVHTPGGHLYQVLTVPFTTDPTRAGSLRTVEGYPRPLRVQPAEVDPDGGRAQLSVVARLPVAGTSIVHSSLYGQWTAQAFLDDATESCGQVRAFFLQP